MNLIPWRRNGHAPAERDMSFPVPFQEYVNLFYQGIGYPMAFPLAPQTMPGTPSETIDGGFAGLYQGAMRTNSIVSACLLTRQLHFQQARFKFRQRLPNGLPGNIFGTGELQILEEPWPKGSTSELLARMIQDTDLAGNFYAVRQGDRLVRLRPDWVNIVIGSNERNPDWEAGDPDTTLIGYQFNPGGLWSGRPASFYPPGQVAHWRPLPDPLAYYKGVSLLGAAVAEIQADQAMSQHRMKLMEQGATVNHVATIPATTVEAFEKWVEKLEQGHAGIANAYRTVYLGAGADMKAIGSDMQQLDFANVQAGGEARIAAALRVPAVILGIREGLAGSALNSGNYAATRRNFGDGVLRPLWESACAALAPVVNVPGSSELWYNDRDIPFLQEDLADRAKIQQSQSVTAQNLINSGFEPDAVIAAIAADDITLLKNNHTGLTSVQLQPPNSGGTITGGTV